MYPAGPIRYAPSRFSTGGGVLSRRIFVGGSHWSSDMRGPVVSLVRRLAGGLRYPRLLALTAALFVIDLIVPDAIPLADEVLLGLVTVLLATRRRTARG